MQNIYEQIRERHDLVETAQSLGISLTRRSGNTYRGTLGKGKEAFCIYCNSQHWHDYHDNIGGDVTDLVAHVKYNGDKSKAIHELAPDIYYFSDYGTQRTRYEAFQEEVKQAHRKLMNCKGVVWDYLISRGITPEYIKQMKLGIWYWGGQTRLAIPYWNGNMKECQYLVHREIQPSEAKYAKLSLDKYPFLRNGIWGLHTIDRENDILYITEGAFDAMRLDMLGCSVLSSMGTAFSKENWEKVIRIASEFKKVIIAYDTDDAGMKATMETAKSFMREHIQFAVVQHSYKDIAEFFEDGNTLEELEGQALDGSWWLALQFTDGKPFSRLTNAEQKKKTEDFKQFIIGLRRDNDDCDIALLFTKVEDYFPKAVLKEIKKATKKGPDDKMIAEAVLKKHTIVSHDKIGILVCNPTTKVWRKISYGHLKKEYVLPELGKHFSYTQTERVAKLVRDMAFNEEFVEKLNLQPRFAVQNGTLHFNPDTGEVLFLEHAVDDYVTHHAGYCYMPNVECVKIKKALLEIFGDKPDYAEGPEQMITLRQALGYIFFPDNRYQKSIVNMGVGGNGKSFVCELVKAMLGGDNQDNESLVSATPMSRLGKDFRLMKLKDSWINISGETDLNLEGSESAFKMIVGGDTIEDSYKGKDPISFKTRSKLWLNCNSYPMCQDKTKGMARRFLFIDYPINFVDGKPLNENERHADPNLLREILNDPIELAGLLNWAIEGFKSLVHNGGFIETETQKKHMAAFLRFNDPAISFIEDNDDFFFSPSSGNGIENQRSSVYRKYANWCRDNGEEAMSARTFFHLLANTARAYGSEVQIRQRHGYGWQLVIVRRLRISHSI